MNRTKLTFVVPVLGLFAMAARWVLYALGTDDRGLLVSHHPAGYAALLFTLLAVAAVWFAQEPEKKLKSTAVQSLALALGLVVSSNGGTGSFAMLNGLLTLSRYAAAVILAVQALFAFQKKSAPFGLGAGLCVCFIFRMVGSYQVWSRVPQIQNYLFALLAGLCIMAFAYQQAAGEAGLGSPKRRFRIALLGCYFCMAASIGATAQIVYLLFAVWLYAQALCPIPKEAQ